MTDRPARPRHDERGLTMTELAVVTLIVAVLAIVMLTAGTG